MCLLPTDAAGTKVTGDDREAVGAARRVRLEEGGGEEVTGRRWVSGSCTQQIKGMFE